MNIIKIAFLVLLPIITECQETWTIEDCIGMAIENNIDISISDMDILNGGIDTKLSQQDLLPNLEAGSKAGLGFGRSIDPTSNDFVNSNILSSDIGLSTEVNIYQGGILKNRIAQNKVEQEILQANRQLLVADVVIDMIQAYFNTLLAKDNHSNIVTQLQSINEQIRHFEKLVKEGSRAQYELVELHAQQANIERELLSADYSFKEAKIYLKSLINLESDVDFDLTAPSEEINSNSLDALSVDALTKQAMQTFPELNVYDLIQQKGDIGLKIAQGLKKPNLSLRGRIGSNFSSGANRMIGTTSVLTESSVLINGNRATISEVNEIPRNIERVPYTDQLNNNLSYGLSINLVVPIFDRYKSQGAREKAQLQIESIKADREKWTDGLNYQMSQYLNKAKENSSNLKASEKLLSIRKLATENAIKRFEHGAISSFDFIDFQEKQGLAEFDYLNAKYQYMKIIYLLNFYQGKFYQRDRG